MTQLPPFLTPRQAAEALTEAGIPISEDAVRRWCRLGHIAAIKLPGGTFHVRGAAIEALLSGGGQVLTGASP